MNNLINPENCDLSLSNASVYRRWKDNLIKVLWMQEIEKNRLKLNKLTKDSY